MAAAAGSSPKQVASGSAQKPVVARVAVQLVGLGVAGEAVPSIAAPQRVPTRTAGQRVGPSRPPIVPLGYFTVHWAARPEVGGLRVDSTGGFDAVTLSIDEQAPEEPGEEGEGEED